MNRPTHEVYIYQHVPKCGGRSFIKACRKHLNKVADSPPSYSTKEQRAEFVKTKKDLSELPARTLVHGHLVHEGMWPSQRYADELKTGRYGLITVIRNPLERAISAYFHRRKKGKEWHGTLQEWLGSRKNNICSFLGVEMQGDVPVNDPFLMIGLTERLQESLDVFANLAAFPTETIERVNTSTRDPYELSKKELDAYRTVNAMDYALYEYASRKLDQQVAELGK